MQNAEANDWQCDFSEGGVLNSQHERLSYLGQICQFRNAKHYNHNK